MGSPSAIDPRPDAPAARTRGAAKADHDKRPSREQQLRELGLAFRRTFRNLNRLRGRDTHLGGEELSHAQFELLIELWERGELPAGELAAAARLSPATVTQMLEHLADSGHVERVRSKTDRRVVVSRLTPKGAGKIEAKHAAWQQRWEQAMRGLDTDELRGATRVLQRLAAMLEEGPGEQPCARPEAGGAGGAGEGRNPV
ncbi:MAG TPA: MarR family transcriptional regulator [Solirubrobacteraceae bacterium]|nr:MarR family transcriptional regulator [Solirubrobacteraceae bacterium]